jgi:hypothetical protein
MLNLDVNKMNEMDKKSYVESLNLQDGDDIEELIEMINETHGTIIMYVKSGSPKYTMLAKLSLAKSVINIEYIEEPNSEMVLEVVKRNPSFAAKELKARTYKYKKMLNKNDFLVSVFIKSRSVDLYKLLKDKDFIINEESRKTLLEL